MNSPVHPLGRAWVRSILIVSFTSSLLMVANVAGSKSPEQFMSDGVLVSINEPAIAMSVDDALVYLGRHPIAIGEIAAGERFVFVDASDAVIRRMLIVQFEGFLPEIDNEYRYDLRGKPIVAGYPFRSNGYAFDLADAIEANPTKESASTNAFLAKHGLIAPAEIMMWRSLTVVDKQRKKEMIIFYMEDVASSGLTLADLYQDDAATQAWIEIQKQLEVRANNAYRLTGVSAGGKPDTANWESVPATVMVGY